MTILSRVVEVLGKVDELKGVAVAVQKVVDAKDAGEVVAASGQLAAEISVGIAVNASLRTAFSALRLGLAVSGQIWKWETLSKVAGIGAGMGVGALIDWVNEQNLGSGLYDVFHPEIDPATNTAYLAARSYIRKDPLALDLDGDGIETRAATGDAVTLFDYNADGIRTGTGWVGPDDGLVVMDRNGNGSIDSGAELFGVDTVRADGSNATDGFNALADLDSNHDGLFNASDAAFGQVRLWQDANSDGISQAGELKTLAQQGIKAIHLAATASGQILSTQNQIAYTGTFDKTNGTTGTAYAVSRG